MEEKTYLIYKIQFPNGKCYIGQSCNYHKRISEHLREASKGNDIKLYRAMRKYGTSKEDFFIIEENIIGVDSANEREIFYIVEFNSYKEGYNSNTGGNNREHASGEKHHNSNLSDKELQYLREIRSMKTLTPKEVFEKYFIDKVSFSGFSKYWNYETRPDIANELDTLELREFYKKNKSYCTGSLHVNSELTVEQVKTARKMYWVDCKSMKEVHSTFSQYSFGGISKVVRGATFKNIPMPISNRKERLCLSKDDVRFIRYLFERGYKVMQIIRRWFPKFSETLISQVVNGKRH